MLPEGWVETTIGEIVQQIETVDPSTRPHDEFKYIDIGSIDNEHQQIGEPKTYAGIDAPSRARRRVRAGDVLFATVRPYLKNIAQVPFELDGEVTSTGICVLRPTDGIEGSYIFRRVISADFIQAMTHASDGTMYPAIADRDVQAGTIKLPPTVEQRRIVAKLDALTARLARARSELDRIRALVHRQRAALLQGLASAGWPTRRLGDITRISGGKRLPSGHGYASSQTEYAYVRVSNFSEGTISGDGMKYISADTAMLLQRYRITSKDLYISIAGSIGQVGRVPDNLSGSFLTENAARITPVGDVSLDYLYHFLNSAAAQRQMAAKTVSTAVSKLALFRIEGIELQLPSLAVQNEITRHLDQAFARADRLEAEAARARKLIDRLEAAILAKAFRGELVPQDPDDEPASVLLQRIRAARAAAPKPKRGRRAKTGADA